MPIPSMYGIFTYFWLILMVNVADIPYMDAMGMLIHKPFGFYVILWVGRSNVANFSKWCLIGESPGYGMAGGTLEVTGPKEQ